MRKLTIILLLLFISCSKVTNIEKVYPRPIYILQEKNNAIYYYKIIGYKYDIPIIDSVYYAKEYK